MAQPKNYDGDLHMIVHPKIELDDVIVNRLRFMRWLMEANPQAFNDGRIEGKSDGPVIDFLAEKAKRESGEVSTAA